MEIKKVASKDKEQKERTTQQKKEPQDCIQYSIYSLPESSLMKSKPEGLVLTMSCTEVRRAPALATRKVPGSISR